MRANLSFDSAAFRHALRLSLCLVAGELVAASVGWRRTYWLPMTIAIVLRPDFTTTFSRGVLRLAGTLLGLIATTVLFHILSPGPWLQVTLMTLAVFVMRSAGRANYGLYVATLSALVVLLVAMTGTLPQQAILARGLNTAAGGVLALLSWIVWPTWERRQVSDALSAMLDSYQAYLHAVREAYLSPGPLHWEELDRVRSRARTARSNAEASVDRVNAEPGATLEQTRRLGAILASSHRLVHTIMAFEAGLLKTQPIPPRAKFRPFSHEAELTLHSLAAALRGSPLTASELPDLREGHHALVHTAHSPGARYTLVNIETDRLTNSLNTLTGLISEWIAQTRASRSPFDEPSQTPGS